MKQLYFWKSGLLSLLFLVSVFQLSWAQSTVSGTVTDEKKEPVIGASVQIKGTTIGVVTDANGRYSIKVPDNNAVLTVTYVGYVKSEQPVAGKTSINFSLNPETTSLNEVVVTGYGSQRKKDLTGAVAVVNISELKAQPVASAVEALQGKATGVQIVSDGAPGATPQIRVRGFSTINNNDPLYVIDGVPYEGKLSWLNQNDIESMQVLKDASASSIYGSRANNGVVIITTKKGLTGPPKISFDAYYGSQNPRKDAFPKFLNPQQYAEYVYSQYRNAGSTQAEIVDAVKTMYGTGNSPVLPDYLIAGSALGQNVTAADADPSKYNYTNDGSTFYQITRANKAGTNWFDAITQNAPTQSYQVSATGGGENASYAMSGGYLGQEGTIKYTGFQRYNIRANTNFTSLDKRFRFGENAQYSYTEGFGFGVNPNVSQDYQGEGSVLGFAYRMPTIIPQYDINGNFAGTRGGQLGNSQNPLALSFRAKDNKNRENFFFGNAYAEVDIITGLVARTSFGIRYNNYNGIGINYPNLEFSEGSNANGMNEYQGYGTEWTWTNTLTYKKNWNDVHNLTLLAGTEAIKNRFRQLNGSRNTYFLLGNQDYYYLDAGTTNIGNSSFGGVGSLFSLFGRADYSYKDRYLLSATVRRDGSSNFGPENKYGVFPAGSVAWRLSEEEFLKGNKLFTDLKLRAGYGVTGNQRIPGFQYLSLYQQSIGTSSYPFGGSLVNGIWQNTYNNPSVKWEQLSSINVGLDFTLANGVFDGAFDWYDRKTKDMLYPVPLPNYAAGGGSSPYVNIGDMSNKGFEISLGYHYGRVDDKPFKFDAGVNFSRNVNQIVRLAPSVSQQIYGNYRSLQTSILKPGEAFSSFFGYKVQGIYASAAEITNSASYTGARVGGFRYEDLNGDGVITDADRTVIGSPHPDFIYSLSLNASYKNFDVSMFFNGSQGNDLFEATRYWTDFGVFAGATSTRTLSAWSPTNTGGTTPSAYFNSGSLEYASSSYYVQDGSFFRMKNLQIGYTLPAKKVFGEKLGIDRLRVYVSGTNLFTITKYTGLDPEVSASGSDFSALGVDQGIYPVARQFLIGVNVGF